MERIGYWRMAWPFGELVVATSDFGIRRLTWTHESDAAPERDAVLERLRRELGESALSEAEADATTRDELERYLDGRLALFTVPVDPRPRSRFQERVLRRLMHTRVGECLTYGELASAVGSPGGAQAVGQIMATNPVPIVIPCHRVLPSDHSLGNFTGGIEVKRFLLGIEGHRFPDPTDAQLRLL